MSDAAETIWTCVHVGEYGNYFPEAVEAEGEYGGCAVEYRLTSLPATNAQAFANEKVQKRIAVLFDALGAIEVEYDPSEDGINARTMYEIAVEARAALAAMEADDE
jgi:hypothetical protein